MKTATAHLTLDQLFARLCPVYEGGTSIITRRSRADAILEFISDKDVSDDAIASFNDLEAKCLQARQHPESDDLYCLMTESLVKVCELLVEGLGSPVREIMTEGV